MDGKGTVRVLRVNSPAEIVATFSQQPQPFETWFAVSPTGSRILAGVLTFDTVGSYFSLYVAAAGGSPKQTVNAAGVGQPYAMVNLPFPVRWISGGPVAMEPVSLGTQNAWVGGPLQLLNVDDASGVTGTALGGPDCNSASITSDGLIPCISADGGVSVRDSMGKLIWATHVQGFNALWLNISPDGQAISDGLQVETHAGGKVTMPQGFRVEGWLNNNTVVGRVSPEANTIGSPNEGNLSWISLEHPNTLHDLGFKGDFVGTLA